MTTIDTKKESKGGLIHTLIRTPQKKSKNLFRTLGIVVTQQNPHFASVNKSIATLTIIPTTVTCSVVQINKFLGLSFSIHRNSSSLY